MRTKEKFEGGQIKNLVSLQQPSETSSEPESHLLSLEFA